ncbi:MAG: hypothetical protein R3209_06420 [Salinimicrobium sediminis]|nr:hypothetical protein [Salinimicrobium sediminis]
MNAHHWMTVLGKSGIRSSTLSLYKPHPEGMAVPLVMIAQP